MPPDGTRTIGEGKLPHSCRSRAGFLSPSNCPMPIATFALHTLTFCRNWRCSKSLGLRLSDEFALTFHSPECCPRQKSPTCQAPSRPICPHCLPIYRQRQTIHPSPIDPSTPTIHSLPPRRTSPKYSGSSRCQPSLRRLLTKVYA